MNQLTSKTLAQIVTGNHRTATVLEKYHLDFCCKGKRSLQQACVEQNISIDELAKELENLSSQSPGAGQAAFPFDRLSLTELVNYIVTAHHDYIKRESPQIAGYLGKIASKHGDRHPELFRVFQLFTIVKEEMDDHMQEEEVILFPRIRNVEKSAGDAQTEPKMNLSYLEAPIRMLEDEHAFAGKSMEEIRLLTSNYTAPPDACITYKLAFECLRAFETDLHQHVHLENNILFPRALKLLGKACQSSLN
jgi:regulator of cell morphogenesis and NO signaling